MDEFIQKNEKKNYWDFKSYLAASGNLKQNKTKILGNYLLSNKIKYYLLL